jgi:predicted enzyme involved in methoxymalonyl-ACP biosynthesis
MRFILNQIYKKGFHRVQAEYIFTEKNGQVKNFYENNGFIVTGSGNQYIKYSFEINNEIEINSYCKIIES